jgi:hypothetical protein
MIDEGGQELFHDLFGCTQHSGSWAGATDSGNSRAIVASLPTRDGQRVASEPSGGHPPSHGLSGCGSLECPEDLIWREPCAAQLENVDFLSEDHGWMRIEHRPEKAPSTLGVSDQDTHRVDVIESGR